MQSNIESTTVRDIARLINTDCLTAKASTSLEYLSKMLCASDRYKVYLENEKGELCGVLQAKQIAMELIRMSRSEADSAEMLPAQAYLLNSRQADDLAEDASSVTPSASLQEVLEMMEKNHIREIAVVDEQHKLIGILEAKHILSLYLREKATATL
jgi:predicted transcriptional regulator